MRAQKFKAFNRFENRRVVQRLPAFKSSWRLSGRDLRIKLDILYIIINDGATTPIYGEADMTETKDFVHRAIKYEVPPADGKGPARLFRVYLSAESDRIFGMASRHIDAINPDLHTKGEELVAEILKYVDGGISKVERFSALREADGSEPVWDKFNRCDGIDGEPAKQEWNDKFVLVREEHYDENGDFNDSIKGVPAIRIWNKEGVLTSAGRFLNGKKNDSPDGDLGSKHYRDDGSHAYAWSCKNGEHVREYSREEFIAYEQSRKAAPSSVTISKARKMPGLG
ncbi:MAG: hypothetical protein V1721_07020 [Pseudomonadota bacterium]